MNQTTVTVSPRKTNHLFHLFMTIFTFGLWSPVWILMSLLNKASKDISRTYITEVRKGEYVSGAPTPTVPPRPAPPPPSR